MKFGPAPLDAAEGSVLAHSVRLTKGRLRKGVILDAKAIADLRAAGIDQVTVARLDADDCAENPAAEALAQSLRAENAGLHATAAFTGRVNLLAEGAGVVRLNASAVRAANAVHPMITCATVPEWQQMAPGGMVATIKIIAYGVPRAALEQACAAGRDAIALAQPVMSEATLIITDIPGGPGDKGAKAIETRLSALDVTLTDTLRCPHDTTALAAAIAGARTPLVLILTGSATSDIDDVAPAALRAAGGQVERFGMPVDPGNLLFLGQLDGQAVIGLPGCARSPALNGADWVLSRVVCGIPVTAQDIAGMAVGGLLKEIPTRPQPRAGRRVEK